MDFETGVPKEVRRDHGGWVREHRWHEAGMGRNGARSEVEDRKAGLKNHMCVGDN